MKGVCEWPDEYATIEDAVRKTGCDQEGEDGGSGRSKEKAAYHRDMFVSALLKSSYVSSC